MKFVPTVQLVKKAFQESYAVPAFCAWNAEMIDIILQTAERMQSPVIILAAWVDFKLINTDLYYKLASKIAEQYTIPAALHLDHGRSLEEAQDCINARFSGVMVDYSARNYAENVQIMKKTVELAKPHQISVEGEIGHVGRVDESTPEGKDQASLTEPEEAARFVQETGIDMVAVSIGNIHGSFKGLPKLDFEQLQKIHKKVDIPLVLHGGSGTPEKDLKECIKRGIAKVNVASEVVKAVRESILQQWHSQTNMWVPLAFTDAIKTVPPILKKWIKYLGSENKA